MDDETVRRVRMVGAYAGLHSEVKLAGALGISKDTLRRIFDGTRPWRELEMGEQEFLQRVADLAGLPAEVFTVDFQKLGALAALSPEMTEVAQLAAELKATVRATVTDMLSGMPEEDRDAVFARVDQLTDEERRAMVEDGADWPERLRPAAATPPADGAPPQPPGELGRRASGAAPTPQPQEPGKTPAAAGQREGARG